MDKDLDMVTEFINLGASSMIKSLLDAGVLSISEDGRFYNGVELDSAISDEDLSEIIRNNTNEMMMTLPFVEQLIETAFDDVENQVLGAIK